jgi:hypothetical protein
MTRLHSALLWDGIYARIRKRWCLHDLVRYPLALGKSKYPVHGIDES